MSEEPELVLHPSTLACVHCMDREMLLAMSKVLVAMTTNNNAKKYGGDLALTQYKYRQEFFPETIEP